jgi:hypothetical protein
MIDDTQDERWHEALRDLARDYHEPPMIVPRDEMWQAIVAGQRRGRPRIIVLARRVAPLAAAAAIVLGVGIGVGRWSVRPSATPAGTALVPQKPQPPISEAYTIATTQQLVQAQALLTAFTAAGRDATNDARLAAWARDVLSNTRLLLDSPAGADPKRRQLLEDLELVLVQIAELSPDAAANDRAAIDRTLDRAQVLPRLKAAIPVDQVGL